uniref:MHC class I-like antigen recognition-like domain-containing protein n=1 Tax=Rhinopithecus roxellana TaxID=61622 RepID=A0A2K6PE94_RHIRO
MVAPAAGVLLWAVRAALTSTVPDLLGLPAGGSPRGLASGRLPLAAIDSSFGFVLSKHWGDDCYPTNRLWQDLKLAPPVQWHYRNLERVHVDMQVSANGDFLRGRARGRAGLGGSGSGSGSPRERGRPRRPGRSPGSAQSSEPTQARSRARGRRGGAVARVCRPESWQRWARPTSSHGGLIRGRRKNGIEAFQ